MNFETFEDVTYLIKVRKSLVDTRDTVDNIEDYTELITEYKTALPLKTHPILAEADEALRVTRMAIAKQLQEDYNAVLTSKIEAVEHSIRELGVQI